ncbi:MAG: sigma-70 family RNA polymerase sigma factor [Ruminococcaceae bacterium]|nr:sigma-70 family RNA polymerase sigma factor [Oscillospiraceae bacterium]
MWDTLVQFLSQMFFMVLHVANASSFPKPLSAREEREALAAAKQGDAQARRRLIEHNLRLVAHIIKKRYGGAREQEDLVSIGTIGLIKAVDTFNASKGPRLATYAARCIENEILMHFRAQKKTAQDVSLSEPIDTDSEGRPLTLMDVLAGEDTIVDDLDRKLKLERLPALIRECLDPRERQIISLRYGLSGTPLTQRQVAERLDISRSYISRLETHALRKLRQRFEQGTAGR